MRLQCVAECQRKQKRSLFPDSCRQNSCRLHQAQSIRAPVINSKHRAAVAARAWEPASPNASRAAPRV